MKFQKQMEAYSFLRILKSYTSAIIISCCLIGCEEKQLDLPVLEDEDKLVNVMVDMYIAESALNKQSVHIRDSLTNTYRDNIISIHNISEEEFDTLFWLIQTDMVRYKELHKKVVARLNDLNSKSSTK